MTVMSVNVYYELTFKIIYDGLCCDIIIAFPPMIEDYFKTSGIHCEGLCDITVDSYKYWLQLSQQSVHSRFGRSDLLQGPAYKSGDSYGLKSRGW
jgi:hypothetical protein